LSGGLRIAILTPTAAPALLGGSEGPLGGAEQQLAALGRALQARGHVVDFMVAGNGGLPVRTSAGQVWPRFPLHGLPLLKLVHPKGTALLRFLRERRSQILLQRGAAELTGLAGAAARLARIPFVFMLSSDLDLAPGREIMPHPQDRLLYAAGLRAADCVVAQTWDQARRLRRMAGREAAVLRPFPSGAGGLPAAELAGGRAILWAAICVRSSGRSGCCALPGASPGSASSCSEGPPQAMRPTRLGSPAPCAPCPISTIWVRLPTMRFPPSSPGRAST
jgi:hypothetical protein